MNGKKLQLTTSDSLRFNDQDFQIENNAEAVRLRTLSLSLSEGNQQAWEDIYRLLYDSLLRFIKRIIKNPDNASDVTQEVFIALWENNSKINPERNIKGYIYAIARTFAYRYLRDYHKTPGANSLSDVPEPDMLDVGPDDILSGNELKILIMLALERMPKIRRRVFEMSRFEGLGYDEIAERLNVSRRTVEGHIYNVTKELKEILYLVGMFVFINPL